MRLENKLHKWLKFGLKMFAFLPIIFAIFNFFTYQINSEFVNIDSQSIMEYIFNSGVESPYLFFEYMTSIFSSFNHWAVAHFLGSRYNLGYCILLIVEYWLMIDFIDLIFSAFRFIIDFARDFLDSFYKKGKGDF